jgi:NAD-dependent deacetylase
MAEERDVQPEQIAQAADLIAGARRLVVFTGAGISTESGIPDFRSPGGFWDRNDPNEWTFQNYLANPEHRKRVWKRYLDPTISDAQPNAAHRVIGELHELGILDCVITQNIDGLHQKGGVPPEKVIELHGTHLFVKCLQCRARYRREQILPILQDGVESPTCEQCGGLLKAATISFGESMPEQETREAEIRSRLADVFLVIGSTLIVYPAAFMPVYALQAGAPLILVNLSDTPLDDEATILIRAKAGPTMAAIVEAVKERRAALEQTVDRGP